MRRAGRTELLGNIPPDDFQTHAYGPGGFGFPSQGAAKAIQGGTQFFYAGPFDTGYGTCGDAQQQWQLKGLGSAIDSGQVKVNLKGYAGTNGSPLIMAHVDLYFRDPQNHSVARDGITRSVSGSNEEYMQTKGVAVLPSKTRCCACTCGPTVTPRCPRAIAKPSGTTSRSS